MSGNARDAIVKLDMSANIWKSILRYPSLSVHLQDMSALMKADSLLKKSGRKPYSVVLFDEIEKEHIPMYSICFFQILEDGVLTDSQGKKGFFQEFNYYNDFKCRLASKITDNKTALGFWRRSARADSLILKHL